MKLVKESLEYKKIPLADVTWDDVKPIKDEDKWSPDYVNLPYDFMSSLVIKREKEFNEWYKEFIEKYGMDGFLVKWSPTSWKLEENPIFDKESQIQGEYISKYYRDKPSGGYTGD